jgi:hypothetical protein
MEIEKGFEDAIGGGNLCNESTEGIVFYQPDDKKKEMNEEIEVEEVSEEISLEKALAKSKKSNNNS